VRHHPSLEAVLARLDARDPRRPCARCDHRADVRRRLRAIGRDLLFVAFFVLGMLAVLFLALVVVFATAGFPAHA
jgi:hypothetical protein